MSVEAVMKLEIPFPPAFVDVLAIACTAAMFALACLYIRECERLKGPRT